MTPKSRPISIRRKSAARLAAVQTLFDAHSGGRTGDEAMASYRKHFLTRLLADFDIDALDDSHYEALVTAALRDADFIDAKIAPMLKEGWSLARMSEVERAALRCAHTELAAHPAIPAATIAAEYTAIVEICGGDHPLVNALADNLARDLRKNNSIPEKG